MKLQRQTVWDNRWGDWKMSVNQRQNVCSTTMLLQWTEFSSSNTESRFFLVVPCVPLKANFMWLSELCTNRGQLWLGEISTFDLMCWHKLLGGMQNKIFKRFNGSTRIKHEQFEIHIPETLPSLQVPHLLTYLLHPHPAHCCFRLGIFSRIFRSFIRKHIARCSKAVLWKLVPLLQIMRHVTSDLLISRVRGVGEQELKIATMSGRTMDEASKFKNSHSIELRTSLALSESTAVNDDAGAPSSEINWC